MSGLATLHQDAHDLSVRYGEVLRQAGAASLLTDAQVAAATTAEDLVTNIQNANVHEENQSLKLQAIKAIRAGAASGEFSDARIQAATGVTDLVNDTYASEDTDTGHLGPQMTE